MGRDTLKYTHATQGTKNKSINGWTIKALLFFGERQEIEGSWPENRTNSFLGIKKKSKIKEIEGSRLERQTSSFLNIKKKTEIGGGDEPRNPVQQKGVGNQDQQARSQGRQEARSSAAEGGG